MKNVPMATRFYILNKLEGGKHLFGIDGIPISFPSQDRADDYCLNMAVGLGVDPSTFSTTTEAPANVA